MTRRREASVAWRITVAAPLVVGLLLGGWVMESRRDPHAPTSFCDAVTSAFSGLIQSSSGEQGGSSLFNDPPAVADALSRLDTENLLASLPASLRPDGRLLVQRMPAMLRQLRARSAPTSVLGILPPDVFTAIADISKAYKDRCA